MRSVLCQVNDLEALLTKETDYIDLNQFPDHAYYNEVTHLDIKLTVNVSLET